MEAMNVTEEIANMKEQLTSIQKDITYIRDQTLRVLSSKNSPLCKNSRTQVLEPSAFILVCLQVGMFLNTVFSRVVLEI